MEKHIIFYFSGTGNCLQVARDLAEHCKDARLINIADYDMEEPIHAEKVGFVFPVYYFGLPNIIVRFIEQMKLEKVSYLYAVVTYGGAAGRTLKQLYLLLRKRKIKIQAGYRVRMPGNCIALYGAKGRRTQKRLFAKEQKTVRKIAYKVMGRERCLAAFKVNPVMEAFSNKMYAGFDRIGEQGQHFQADGTCTHCGQCEKLCPVGNITLESGVPVWGARCEFCMACIQHCPVKAINYKDVTRKRKRYVNPNVSGC